jgi:GTP pyrophosphokinase
MGLHEIKNELEDLAFKFSQPGEFKNFEKRLKKERADKQKDIIHVVKKLKRDFKKQKIKANFKIKPKYVYSIYNKMQHTGKTFDEIEDTMILVVRVETIDDCYRVLGRIHQTFKPRPRKIKDFIASPQNDFYQSLHTTIVGDKGEIVKVYIRTFEMAKIREDGIIHFMLKGSYANKFDKPNKFDKQFSWFDGLKQLSKDFKGEHFLEALKTDYLSELIPVLTPKGEVIELPKGSTPLDFAYALSPKVGNYCQKAKVNQRAVPLWHPLEAGDKVDIIASPKPQVKKEWLDFTRSQKTTRQIKQALKKIKKAKLEPDLANIRIKLADKPGTLFKVTRILAEAGLNILSVHSNNQDFPPSCDLTLRFHEQKKFEQVIKQIEELDEILELKYQLV